MANAKGQVVALVHARQDDDVVAALTSGLEKAGVEVRRRRIMGVPAKTFGDELDPNVRDAGLVVVVISPFLVASDWPFSQEAGAILASRGRIVVWPVAECRFGGSPLAGCPAIGAWPPAIDSSDVAPATESILGLVKGRKLPPPAPLADSMSYPAPAIALLSERLEGLYAIRASRTGVRGLGAAIKRTAAALRKGPQLNVGETLGDGMYRLLELVGHGPLATVWRARDRESGQIVGVKVLHAQWVGSRRVLEYFFEMARRTAELEHPHVAAVVDPGGTDRGFPYYVQRFLSGASLEGAVATGELDTARALQTILDVSRALEHAHERGLIHGNLKPSNVLLDEAGMALVGDFAPEPQSGRAEGRDAVYMAPESQDPEVKPTAASDVYSLAMTTLFALYGKALPFWVLRSPERLIDGLECSLTVQSALKGALDWDPEARTPTIAQFVQELLSDRAIVELLCQSAEATGRFEVAADHLLELLDRAEGRPPELLMSLGRMWVASGDDERAEEVLLEVLENTPDERLLTEGLEQLRILATRQDSWEAFAALLQSRAFPDQGPPRVQLLVAAAAITTDHLGDDEAAAGLWTEVLAHHHQQADAERALGVLFARAERQENWVEYLTFGRQLAGYLPGARSAELAHALGVVCMDYLDDTPGALLWLQRASDGGHRSADVPRRLEAIRSARGEWRQVVSLMLERAEALDDEPASVALLMRAAQVALYAHNHHDDAASILLRVLLRDPEHREALRFLARHHARAGRDDRALALYARLAPHEERGREGEPLQVRVADNVDYANVLLRNDRPRGAQLCLEAALDLNPSHVPTLALASQLSLDLGKWEEARMAYEGLVACFGSVDADATYVHAVQRLGDLAWLHGDLQEASEHYNRVLELAPQARGGWWGKAKVAIAGNEGRLDDGMVSRSPWLLAAPVRMTPHEALARLLCALLERSFVESWLRLDPMGPEVLRLVEPHSTLVLMCAAVDVMVARELIRAELFRRLVSVHPAWAGPIESVRRLWFEPSGTHAFPVAESYRWVLATEDFDPRHHRDVLHHEPPLLGDAPTTVRPSLAALQHGSAWKRLLQRKGASPPAPETVSPEPTADLQTTRSALLVLKPHGSDPCLVRLEEGTVVGSAHDDDVSLQLSGLGPSHLDFTHVGSRFYVRTSGPLEVDGIEVHGERRLRGGESLRVGGIPATFYTYADDDPPDVASGFPVLRPAVGEKPVLDGELSFIQGSQARRTPKAAVFYTDAGVERMIPIVGDCLVLDEGPDGELCTLPDDAREFAAKIVHRDGGWRIDENDTTFFEPNGSDGSERPIEHAAEFVIGTRLLQFRLLSRAGETVMVEDLASLWGTPEGVPILVYDDGTRHGRPIALTSDRFSVGRGRAADFQISVDSSLSRVHMVFEIRDDEVYAVDSGSSNGTLVNGKKIRAPLCLQNADVIVIGQTRLEFRSSGAPANPSARLLTALQDFGTEDPTDVLPVGELARKPLPLDEGLDKIRVANRVLGIVLSEMDAVEGSGRGRAELQLMLEARPRTYQSLLDGLEVRDNAVPGLEIMYNLAQRADQEQRPLLNYVLGDLIDRAVDQVCSKVPSDRVDGMLARVAETKYRDHFRF